MVVIYNSRIDRENQTVQGKGTVMKPLPKIGLRLLAILMSVFILVALLDLAGIIVDNPFLPGK